MAAGADEADAIERHMGVPHLHHEQRLRAALLQPADLLDRLLHER